MKHLATNDQNELLLQYYIDEGIVISDENCFALRLFN